MTTEVESLKTLQRIEKLLEQSVASVKTEERAQKQRVPLKDKLASKNSAAPDFDDLNKSIFRASKNLDRLGASADKTADSLQRARGDIISLRSGIRSATGSTSIALSNLNTAVDTVVGSMLMAAGIPEDTRKETANGFTTLGNAAALARIQLGMLAKSAGALNAALEKTAASAIKAVIPADEKRVEATEAIATAELEHEKALRESDRQQSKSSSLLSSLFSRFGINIKEAGDRGEWLANQMSTIGTQLTDALINVTRDIYALQARGIGAGDSLFQLYGHAIRAGMSLEEYTGMLQENSAAVARASNMQAFRGSVKTTTDSLKQLGVFGPAANQLAASMRTNAVALGVPISQVDDVAQKQVETFKELRKSTMMTADGFKELLETVSNNQNVQEDLLGLAPSERAARQQQLIEIGALGHRLGMTQQASAQLTDALLAQRKATAQQRFQAAGYIRQAGAMVGMDTGQAEELAKLRMKKRRTPEEEARFVELSGVLESRLQEMQNSGNIQAEFLSEKMSELLGSTPQGQVQEAAGKAKLASDAGAIQNTDLAKTLGPFGQGVGEMLTTLSGFMKNPLADAMVTFGAMLVQTGLQVFYLKSIDKTLKSGGSDDGLDGGKRRGSKSPKKPGIFKRLGGVVSGAIGAATGANAFADMKFNANGDLLDKKPTVEKEGKPSGKMMGIAKKGVKAFFTFGGPLAIVGRLWGAVEELITGNLGAAFGEAESFNVDFGKSGWLTSLGSFVFSKLDDMVLSIFRGAATIFTGIGDAIIHALGVEDFVTSVLGGTLTNTFDRILAGAIEAWKTVKIGAMETINGITGVLGFKVFDDKTIQDAHKELDETIETRAKLQKDGNATLTSIGENNNKVLEAQKEAAKKAADATRVATTALKDNVVHGIDTLTASAQRTVSAVQATPSGTTSQVAMPQPTKQPGVVPPEVNTASKTQDEKSEKTETLTSSKSGPATEETVMVLKQQLQVLQQMLAYWVNKEDGDNVLSAFNRPSLQSNEKLYSAALGFGNRG